MVVGMPGKKKIALITGVTGQDGFYLAKILLSKNFTVYGTSRHAKSKIKFNNKNSVKVFKTDYSVNSLEKILKQTNPNILYNLAGQSYVSRSWELLSETIASQGVLVSNILATAEKICPNMKILNMSSAEIFDHSSKQPFNENSKLKPFNPYGVAQLLGHNLIEVHRKVKGVWAANSILFPHESVRRPPEFLFPHIINQAKNIFLNKKKILKIGNLNVARDWSYAPIIMQGVFEQSLLKDPIDLCFCSNKLYDVKQLVDRAFSNLGLNYKNYVEVDRSLVRNFEPKNSFGSYKKANKFLGWTPKYDALDVIDLVMANKDI